MPARNIQKQGSTMNTIQVITNDCFGAIYVNGKKCHEADSIDRFMIPALMSALERPFTYHHEEQGEDFENDFPDGGYPETWQEVEDARIK
jgi:hypothetical protein